MQQLQYPHDGICLKLHGLAIFAGLSSVEISKIAASCTIKRCAAKDILLHAEQPVDQMLVVLQGTIKISLQPIDGSCLTETLACKGDIIGDCSLLEGRSPQYEASALETCLLLCMSRHDLLAHLETMPRLVLNMSLLLSERVRRTRGKIKILAIHDLKKRVARQLLDLAARGDESERTAGLSVGSRITQTELAAMIGVSREHVNKALTIFKEGGCVSLDGERHFVIHDCERLRAHCR